MPRRVVISRATALKLRLPHYYTGLPCSHGHRARRLTSNRQCTACHCRRILPRKRDPVLRVRRLRRLVRDRLYTALRTGHGAAVIRELDCSLEEFRRHIEAQFEPGMSWANHGEWHLDHVQSLASFDITDPRQLAAAVRHTNYAPRWAIDNLRKGSR